MISPTILQQEEQLVQENFGLVVFLAKSFNPKTHSELEDYIQEGCIGLLKAIRKYDTSYKTVLTTLAWPYVRWEILNYIIKEKKHKGEIGHEGFTHDNENILFEILPNHLKPIEKRIIELRIKGHTFKEIGKILNGRTRGWANHLYHLAIKKISKANE